MDPNHIEWCRNLFGSLAEGGTWAVPRSGLIYQRHGDMLVLTARMPHDPAMPITAAMLAEQQDADFDATREHFGAAGIEVIDQSGGES